MRRGYKAMVIACTMLVLISTIASHAWATGLHFTKEEIAIWRARKDNGPYKDEWTTILNRATSWRNNPDSRWAGNTTNDCWPNTRADQLGLPRTRDAGLRDAGFVFLITGDTSYRNAARTQLLAQAQVAGTDWTNTAKWCPSATNASFQYDMANWIRRLAYGYSYIRHTLSAGDVETLDDWFLAAGNYLESVINNIVERRFPGRLSDNYTCSGSGTYCPGNDLNVTHFGGPMVKNFSNAWANTSTAIMANVAAIAVVINDATLKERSARFFKEWIKYATFAGGQIMDQYRGVGHSVPSRSYRYPRLSVGSMITIADHFARDGDPSLYEFQTSDGLFGTEGGPKSLLKVLQHLARQDNGTVIEYASPTSTSDPNLIIKSDMPTEIQVLFVNLTPANVYYTDPEIKQAYTRALPGSWNHIGCDMLCGDWCTYPRIRFMFGQIENKVWPYGTTNDTKPPSSPRGLKVVNP